MSILVTLVAAIALLSVLSLVAVIPAVFAALPWLAQDQAMILLLRWPVLLAFGILTFAAFYRFAPDRRAPPAHFIWPGAIIASVLWLVACAAFSFYVEFAGNLEATFGSLATAIVLLLWMYNSALAVVLGASINAELERDAQGPRTA